MPTATVIHKRDVIRQVRDKWLDQYKHYRPESVVGWHKTKTTQEIRDDLAKLDLDTCTSQDVDSVLGVERWADNTCDECDKDVPMLIRFGQEPDYEQRWWDVCPDCMSSARKLICDTPPIP